MRKPCSIILFALALLAVTSSPGATVASTNTAPQLQIVSLRNGVDVDGLIKEYGLAPKHTYHHAIHGFAAALDSATIAKLQADSRVKRVELDDAQFVPCSQTIPSGIIRMGLTNFPMTRLDGLDDHRINVNVAVLDTGIQIDTTTNASLA